MKILEVLILGALFITLIMLMLPPEFGFIKLYYVSSSSMEPNIPIGSLLITLPQKPINSIGLGDVVVYMDRALGRLVAHRVVGFEKDGYMVKADVGGEPYYVSEEDVVGRVLIAIPFIGWLGVFSSLAPLAFIVILMASISPRSGSLYPTSSASSLTPLILPLREGFPRFLGGYTSIALTFLFSSSSIILYLSEKRASGLLRELINLAYILTSLASVSVVEVPWTW